MKEYKLTLLGLAVSATMTFVVIVFELELFEKFIAMLHELEHFEIDELLIPLVVFLIFVVVDMSRRYNKHKVEVEKVKIYQAMIFSTQHVMNNFLNQMQLFKMKAETTPEFDKEVLKLYDRVIEDAQTQIDGLSSLSQVTEKKIKEAVEPKK